MRNFKVTLDISSFFNNIRKFKLREFDAPFLIIFLQASDPDEVCFELTERLINSILRCDDSIDTRILCRTIKADIRFDRIEML